MARVARSMIVSVRRPRKSNFTSPAASTSSLSNWVTVNFSPFDLIQGRELGDVPRRNHDAARMAAGIAHEAFQAPAEVNDVADVLVLVVELPQLRFLGQRDIERHLGAGVVGHQLGDAIHEAVGLAKHPPHVAHHGARRHRAVGDDLGDAVTTVALADVVDDPIATLHAEIDVEVRHRHALGIQEALEEQIVVDRIEIGNAERPGHQRARTGATPRAHRNLVLASPANEVRDDQEVAGKTHAADHVQFRRPDAPHRRVLASRPGNRAARPCFRLAPEVVVRSWRRPARHSPAGASHRG